MSRERAAKAMLRGTCWLQRCVSALNTCETMWRDQNTVVLYSGALCALSEGLSTSWRIRARAHDVGVSSTDVVCIERIIFIILLSSALLLSGDTRSPR